MSEIITLDVPVDKGLPSAVYFSLNNYMFSVYVRINSWDGSYIMGVRREMDQLGLYYGAVKKGNIYAIVDPFFKSAIFLLTPMILEDGNIKIMVRYNMELVV